MSKDESTEALPALGLKLKDQPLHFFTLAEFEFAVSGRTAVPSVKIQRLVQCSMHELRAEARRIMDAEKHLTETLWHSIEGSASFASALRELDLLIFSQDHNWRDIIRDLNELDETYDAFRRIAVIKYLQYLASRQDLMRLLYNERKSHTDPGDTSENGYKDTLMVDATLMINNSKETRDYKRIPKGEAVHIHLPANSEMELRLAKHPCQLVNNGGFKFQYDQSNRHQLEQKKRCTIGRDSECDITVNPDWRDVSRTHLVVEVQGAQDLEITDISSHGTFIPANYLFQQSA